VARAGKSQKLRAAQKFLQHHFILVTNGGNGLNPGRVVGFARAGDGTMVAALNPRSRKTPKSDEY
jgi:hypothetical protein